MMTTTVDLKTQDGGTAGSVTLDAELFGIEPNLAVLHQVVTAQLAARRSGSANTKTRAEVRGGGASPTVKRNWSSQTGSITPRNSLAAASCMVPKPRSYRKKINKKNESPCVVLSS